MFKPDFTSGISRRVQKYLLLYTLLLVVFISILTSILFTQSLLHELKQNLTNDSRYGMLAIERQLDHLYKSLLALSHNRQLINGVIDTEDYYENLPRILEGFAESPYVHNVALSDFLGRNIYFTGIDQKEEHLEILTQLNREKTTFKIIQQDILISVPVIYYGTSQATLVAHVDLAKVSQDMTQHMRGIEFNLIHRDKTFIKLGLAVSARALSIFINSDEQMTPLLHSLGISVKSSINNNTYLQPLWTLFKWLSLVLFIAFVIAAIFGILIGQQFLKPILVLHKRIANTEDDFGFEPLGTDDELEELALAFEQKTQLLKKTNLDLEERTKAAEAANQAKSSFLANMSHEIRTPMNAIIGMTHLAIQSGLNDRQKNHIDKAHQSAQRLVGIINNILDFSKMEAGKLEVEESDFKLKDVMSNLLNMVMLKADEKNIPVKTSMDSGVPKILFGDELRISQVLINLVNNAIKFSDSGDAVEVNIALNEESATDALIQFSVIDNGIGLSPQQIQNLFQPFSQADVSTTRQYGGTGLGLAISKELVQIMNGKLWVESKEGAGSKFYFTVRLKKQQGTNSHNKTFEDNNLESVNKALTRLRGAKILLVEDNEINQELARELLLLEGMTVETAENGEQALRLLTSQHFDGVLMDCQMPVMDGYEATINIRKQQSLTGLPVIAMSANAMKGDREKVLAVGMNDHIPKPIDPDAMFLTMAKWISVKHQDEVKAGIPVSGSKELPNLPGIDTKAGLKVVRNNVKLYRKLLIKFRDSQQDFKQTFLNAQDGNEQMSPSQIAHTLKGLAGNLGMPDLQLAALSLETACNEQTGDIDERLDEVNNNLMTILAGLKTL